MPASGGDPVTSALRLSLASERSGDLDKRLVASSAKVLLSHIEYESTGNYKSTVLDNLKGKYIVLRTGGSITNGNVCPKSPGKKVTEEMRPEPDAALPTPKVTLYPAEKIQLGWRGTFPVGTGMINVGNTCYLNSTLQALFHIPALVNWLKSDLAHLEKCTLNGAIQSDCIVCALNKTMQASHNKGAGVIKPVLIYNKLKMICKHMNHGQQEDAHEFMRYLIESMEKSFLLRYKGYKLDNYSKETTPLNQIFGGYIRSEVTCLQCRAVSTTFQHFQDLLLDIRRANSVEDALSAYFTHERLEGDDAYKCERCHRKVPANKKFSLEKPPLVLCIQLKRFSILGGKLNKHVEFPQRLDLTRFLCQQSQYRGGQPLAYRLVSLVLHMGASVNCGHYTAIAQTSSGHWYQFDDSSVRPVSLNAVLDMNAYIIIYEMDKFEANVPSSKSTVSTKPATITSSTSQNNHSNGIGFKSSLQRIVSPVMIPSSVKAASQANGILNNHKPPSPVRNKSSPVRTVKPVKPEVAATVNTSHSGLPSQRERARQSPTPQSLVPYDPGDSTGTDSEPETDTANGGASPIGADDNSCPSPLSRSPTPPPLPVTTVNPSPSPSRRFYIPRANWQVTEQTVACTVKSVDSNPTPSDSSTPTAAATTIWCVSPLPSITDTTAVLQQQSQQFGSAVTETERQCGYNQNGDDVESLSSRQDEINESGEKETPNGEGQMSPVSGSGRTSPLSRSGLSSPGCRSSQASPVNRSGQSSPVNRDRSPHTTAVRMSRDNGSPDEIRSSSNGKGPNQMWDGSVRSEVVDKLKHMSHQGYAGAQVSSWGGNRCQVDLELDQERDKERKRSYEYVYDEEIDRGRVKKMKFNNNSPHNSRPKYNAFQQYHNEKIRWNNSGNMFPQQGFYRQHNPHPHPPPPYNHKGMYYKNRGGHSFHKFSGSGRYNGSKHCPRWHR